jgi:putative oxidoreductase
MHKESRASRLIAAAPFPYSGVISQPIQEKLMLSKQPTLRAYAPHALAALRIVTAYLFIQHGTAKLFGFPYQSMFDDLQLFSLIGLAGVLEVAGGLLIGVGLFTRPTAFVLSGFMAVAYFMAHASQGNVLAPILNGGEVAVLYSFIFLLFVFNGAGAFSLDERRKREARSMLATA